MSANNSLPFHPNLINFALYGNAERCIGGAVATAMIYLKSVGSQNLGTSPASKR